MLTIQSFKDISPKNRDPFDLRFGPFWYNIELSDKRCLSIKAHVSYPKANKILYVDIIFVNHSSDFGWTVYPYGDIKHVSLRFAERMLKEMHKTGCYDEVFLKYRNKA